MYGLCPQSIKEIKLRKMDAISLKNMIQARVSESASPNAAKILAEKLSFADYLTEAAGGSSPSSASSSSSGASALASLVTMSALSSGDTSGGLGAPFSGSSGGLLGSSGNNALLLLLLSGLSANGADASLINLLLGMSDTGLSSLISTLGVSGLQSVYSGAASGTAGANVVSQALTRLGDPYSKTYRGTGSYVDCSYLAQWAYGQAGIEIPGTAASQAQYCYENGYVISREELQPGDLIFWTKHSANEGRWNNIHHVGIYLGGGKIVEAKNAKNGVEITDIWGKEGSGGDWEIFMYARPR